MPLQNKIDQHLEKVLQSDEFKSDTYRELLQYLIENSLQQKTPRETAIAIDVFHRDESFDSSEDSTVRSHIYGLRKKLEKYYLTEGRDDDLRFVIPKGRYQVQFEENRNRRSQTAKILVGLLVFIFLITGSILTAHFVYEYTGGVPQPEGEEILPPNPIFNSLVTSRRNLTIVLGDYYTIWGGESETEGHIKIRDGAINSDQDLERFIRQHPEYADQYSPSEIRYLNQAIIRVAFNFSKSLPSRISQELKFTSETSLEEIKDNNLVVFGPFKTLREFGTFFEDSRFRYSHYPHQISTITDAGDTLIYEVVKYEKEYYYRKDYALIRKEKRADNSIVIIIAAFYSGSFEHVMNELKTTMFINRLRVELLKGRPFPKEFEMLCQVNFVEGKRFIKPLYLYSLK